MKISIAHKALQVLVFLLCCTSSVLSQPQSIHIKGLVINPISGLPLDSVQIRIDQKLQKITTDKYGGFQFLLPSSARSLSFSKDGFNTLLLGRDSIHKGNLLTIQLLPFLKDLDSITVSNGYQTLSRERATGSFDKISNATLNIQTGTDILSRLKGVAGGLLFDNRVNNSKGFNIRGVSTFYGPSAPLIVVDGFPYEGDIANINPNDVASITILKDAAASSIWGTKAGNGVVVVSTHKGSANNNKISVSANVKYFQKPNLYYSPSFLTSKDFIAVEESLFQKGFYTALEKSTSHKALSPAVELMVALRDAKITQEAFEQKINGLEQIDGREQFTDYLLSRGKNQQYALSFSGGSLNSTHYISIGLDRNLDELGGSYRRYVFHMDENLKLGKQLTAGFTVNYSLVDTKSGRPSPQSLGINSNSYSYPYIRLVDDLGNPLAVTRDIRQPFIDTFGGGRLQDWNYYPLDNYKKVHKTIGSTDASIIANLTYRPFDVLSISFMYRYRKFSNSNKNSYGSSSYEAINLVNTYAKIVSASSINYPVPQGGYLERTDGLAQEHNGRIQGVFNKTWSVTSVNLLAGMEGSQSQSNNESYRTYGYDEDHLTFKNVDVINAYYNNLLGYSNYIPSGRSMSNSLTRFISYYANASVGYKQKYTWSGSIRKDESNIFGVNSNDKGVPLWSTGVSWDIGREKFWGSSPFDYLRMRLTYGTSGNIDPAKTALTTILYVPNALYTNYNYAIINKIANPSLRWEKVATTNWGFDFSLHNGTIKGSIDYYRKKGTDLFGNAPLDYTTGLGVQYLNRNVAAMRSNGIDLNLDWLILKGNLQCNIVFLGSYNLAKTTNYYNAGLAGSNYISNGLTISPRSGMPLYSVVSYKWAGLNSANGDPQGVLDNHVTTDYASIINNSKESDLVYAGSGMPKYFGSFLPHFAWKSWELTVGITYKLGYYFRRNSINYSQLFNNGIGHRDYYDRWQNVGDEKSTNVPSMVYPAVSMRDDFYAKSDVLVERGDHIRLQFTTLSYSFKSSSVKTGKAFSTLNVMLNASNLGILWRANKRGIDPDMTEEYLSYPLVRNITLGIKTNL